MTLKDVSDSADVPLHKRDRAEVLLIGRLIELGLAHSRDAIIKS